MQRLLNLFRKRKFDERMNEEFAFHLEQLKAEYRAKGWPESAAEAEARKQFGNAAGIAEEYRDQRGVPWLEDVASDLHYAARMLVKNPGFAAIAILTLALGIGANTAVFSMVNAVYLRSAPYPNAARLVDIVGDVHGRQEATNYNSRLFLYLKEHARGFEEVAAVKGGGDVNLIVNGEAEQVRVLRVSNNLFRTLGVQPAMGRAFTAEEDMPGGADTVILTWGLWQRRFGGDPGVLGQTINLSGRVATVAGIMGRDFVSVWQADLFAPLRARPVNDGRNATVFALLRPGVQRDAASREAGDLVARYQSDFDERREFARDERAAVAAFDSSERETSKPLLILFGAVAVTLLIACANLGNLLLSRATVRAREVAIRVTLGAGRSRIARQLLTESLLIAACGAAAGVALAYVALPGLRAISPVRLPPWETAGINMRVLLYTAVAAIATGLAFGSLPAWQATRMGLSDAIKESGGTKASAGRRSGRLRQWIIAAEVALTLMLLIGAGLFLRTFANLMSVRTGVDTTNVVTGQMAMQGERYAAAGSTAAFFRRGLERLEALPNVESAGIVSNLPMERGLNLVALIPGTPSPEQPKLTDWRYASPDYFRTVRIPLLAGRMLSAADGPEAEPVAVINQAFARRYFGSAEAVGRTIHMLGQTPTTDRVRTIVGVVGDVKSGNLRAAAAPTVFVPIEQAPDSHVQTANSYFQASWVVRTRDSGAGMAAIMQRELKAVDPQQPFSGFRTLEEVRSRAVRSERSMMLLLASFAALAMLLAAAGIYGVISYSVAQRAHEIGIRMALGATAEGVVRSIVGQGATVAALGVVAGLAGALALARSLTAFLYGVAPVDPLTFGAAALSLIAVAAAASLAPALRVVRMDPARALRVD